MVCSQTRITAEAQYSYSDSCNFGIFIHNSAVGKNSQAHYELSIEDINISHILLKNHFQSLKMEEGQVKIFNYNYLAKNDSEKKLIDVTIDGKYGQFYVCIKRSDTKPEIKNFESDRECDYKGILNADYHGLSTK